MRAFPGDGLAKHRLLAMGRMPAGTMNKTEEAYAAHLELRRAAGEVIWYRFECMRFKLADNTYYLPDFAVMLVSGELEMHEVKGYWLDDARVKIKVAAEQYPIRFIAATTRKKKEGGGFKFEEFPPPRAP